MKYNKNVIREAGDKLHIHVINILMAFYVLGTVLDTTGNEMEKYLYFYGTYILMGETDNK